MKVVIVIALIMFACICLPYFVLTVWFQGEAVGAVAEIMPARADRAYNWYLGINRRSQKVPPFPGDKKGEKEAENAPMQDDGSPPLPPLGAPGEAPRVIKGKSNSSTVGVGWTGYRGPNMEIFGFPVAGNVLIGCLYGDPKYQSHTGLDLPMGMGTPILATMGGKVVYSGWNGAYGNLVVIENGLYHVYYAHMEYQPPVSVGDIVEPGQQIGNVGSTGSSTGAHLHYEIRRMYVNSYGETAIRNGTAPSYEGGEWAWGQDIEGGAYSVPEIGSNQYNYLMNSDPPGISYKTLDPMMFIPSEGWNKWQCGD